MLNVRTLEQKNALASLRLDNAEATIALGRAFAPSLYMDWSNANSAAKRTRLALLASPGTGKTDVYNGIISTLTAKPLNFERSAQSLYSARFNGKTIMQSWFHSAEMGHVCHADTGFGEDAWRILRSYRDDVLVKQQLGGVDIIENANTDPRYTKFDAAVALSKSMDAAQNRFRMAYIYATPEFAARPAFQEFIEKFGQHHPSSPSVSP